MLVVCVHVEWMISIIIIPFCQTLFQRWMNVDRQAPLLSSNDSSIRNRIPCDHVHHPSGHLPSPSSHQSPDPLHMGKFIHPWVSLSSKRLPSSFIYLLHALQENKREKSKHWYHFRCEYEPHGPVYHPLMTQGVKTL